MGEFWRSTGYKPSKITDLHPKPDVFEKKYSNFDNMVMVTSNYSEYLYNTLDPFADIRSMTGSFCANNGKVLPYHQCPFQHGSFVAYFASKTIPNTMACKAASEDLTQLKAARSEKCSLAAFRLVVKSFVYNKALKIFEHIKTMTTDTPDAKYSTMSDQIYDSLSKHFADYHWEAHFVVGDSIDSCDVQQTNCVTIPFKHRLGSLPSSKIIAVWSPKCDMSPHVGKAKDALDTMVKYNELLYGNVLVRQALNKTTYLPSALMAFMIDPPSYVKNENLTVMDDNFGNAMSAVNFYTNNVLTVLPKESTFYSKSDKGSYRSGTERLLTKRSMLSEKLPQLSDHSVIVSYYAPYDMPSSA